MLTVETVETVSLESLADKVLYVALRFERFGNTRKTHVDMNDEGVVQSRFVHNQKLLVSPELAAIQKADSAIKALVESLCLPSKNTAGLRMLPTGNVKKVRVLLNEYQQETRPALVQALVAVYESQYNEAQQELGAHFNPKHYPAVAFLAAEFNFTYAFVNFGVPGNLQNIDPEAFEEETKKAQQKFIESMEEVSQAMRATFTSLVENLGAGLSGQKNAEGQKKKLHPAHVKKLAEFLAGFDVLNVRNDQALKVEVDKMRKLMEGVDIEKIKESENLRTSLTTQFEDISKELLAMAPVSGRFFRAPQAEPFEAGNTFAHTELSAE
jgi:hypothetical protein